MMSMILAILLAVQDQGTLVVVGGGTTTSEIVKRTLELSGGAKAVVVVLADASGQENAGEASAKMWREAGAARVTVLDLKDAKASVKAVGEATLIWMPGGDQNRLMKVLEKTGVPEAIRERFKAGATVGGTSAGAAVMSKVMITGDADLSGILAGKTATSEGLGLWPSVLVDQHFLKRRRHNRLISAVLDHPDLVGIGIDESTAVIVSGTGFTVIGESAVVVYDARKAKVDKSGARDLKMHVLRAGMKFDLASD